MSIVVNVEEGAELSLGMGDERNESVYEAVEEVTGTSDLCMESHFQYGTRAGWPRIRAALLKYHADLFTPEFWQERKERIAAGKLEDVFPYPVEKRFRNRYEAHT